MSTFAKYPRATTVTIYSLGIFLGLLHVFFGAVAIAPTLSADYHRELKICFNTYAKNLTFLHSIIDKVSLAYYMRMLVGAIQIMFGSMLMENNHFNLFGKMGNFGLLAADLFILFNQLFSGVAYERLAPTIVFSVLLVGRLVILEQSAKKAKVGVRTRNSGKVKSSTPKKNKNE